MRRVALLLIATTAIVRAEPAPPPNIAKVAHRAAGDVPALGPTDALVTIELFFIPGTAQARAPYRALVALQARHPRRVRLVLRPLSRQGMILVPEAVMEAHAQGKFFEMIDAIASSGRTLSRQDVLAIASQVGVDAARVASAWDDERHKAELDGNEVRRQRRYALSVPDALFNGAPVERPLPSLSDADLEATYQDAYDRAAALLDEGVPRKALPEAFERELVRPPALFVPGPVDDSSGEAPPDDPPLATRPLGLAGLPSSGPVGAPVPVVVLCDLTQRSCLRQMVTAVKTAALFKDEVRIVWSPWYATDASADTLETSDLVARAALCAEEQGAGWDFVDKALERTQRLGARWGEAEQAIREVTDEAGADVRALAVCMRVRPPDRARDHIDDAVARGVKHGPAIVVGGRVYMGGVSEPRILQGLIEDELEPGLIGRAAPDWRNL